MPKRNPLVCQHLENISREVLEEHQDIIREYVRRRWGVYALYRRNKIYYVGLASNLRSRLGHHLKDRHHDSWDRFSIYVTIGDSHLRELESLILRIVKPPGNKQKGKFAKSEDLLRRFRRDWMADMRLKAGDIFGGRQPVIATRKKSQNDTDKKQPVMTQYADAKLKLRGWCKKKNIYAFVRKSGLIWFDKKHFSTPSAAASHAVKHPCNGWRFWQYQRAPGDWVDLDELRK